jgi:hypothetical protein
LADLQTITRKIKEAGIIPGFHIHYSKAAKNDPYVSPVPDARLNLVRLFTLSDSIDSRTVTIAVEENPEGCTMEDGRRFLKIGHELVTYQNFTTTHPPTFLTDVAGASWAPKSKPWKRVLSLDFSMWIPGRCLSVSTRIREFSRK